VQNFKVGKILEHWRIILISLCMSSLYYVIIWRCRMCIWLSRCSRYINTGAR